MSDCSESEVGPFDNSPILWNGNYEKVVYFVHLPGGIKVECWPNAGQMNAMDGSDRAWVPEDRVLVSVSDQHPALRSNEYKVRCAEAARQLREEMLAAVVETGAKEELLVSAGQVKRLLLDTPPERPVNVRLDAPWAPVVSVNFVNERHPAGLRLNAGETFTGYFPWPPPASPEEALATLRLHQLLGVGSSMGSLRARETKRLKRQRYLEKKKRKK